jgi:hypothetical protein
MERSPASKARAARPPPHNERRSARRVHRARGAHGEFTRAIAADDTAPCARAPDEARQQRAGHITRLGSSSKTIRGLLSFDFAT